MELARMCRERAIALREMAEEVPELEAQLLFIAQKWENLALLREQVFGNTNRIRNSQMACLASNSVRGLPLF